MKLRENLELLLKEHGYGEFWREIKAMSRQRLLNPDRAKREHLSAAKKRNLYAKQDGRCNECQEPFPINALECHHRDPNRQDFNASGNWALLCKPCHAEIGSKSVMEQAKMFNKTAVEILGDEP